MKKFFTLLITLAILLATATPAFAESINLSTEINNILEHYSKTEKSVDTFESIVAVYSVNSKVNTFDELKIYENDKSYAGLILSRLATKKDPFAEFNGVNPVEALISTQHDNGSFGTFNQHFYSMAALESVKALRGPASVTYASGHALDYLKSLQKEDGSFGDVEKTAKAITILNEFSQDAKVSVAIESAKKYLINTEFTTLNDLCYKVQGLVECGERIDPELMAKIINFKNNDGSYPDNLTITVLLTLDAATTAQTAYGRLIKNGSFAKFTFESLKPYLIAVGILIILSIGFWIYIMTSKKLKKETKQDDIQNMGKDASLQ